VWASLYPLRLICSENNGFLSVFHPPFPTLPGIHISNHNVCEYAWEQILGGHEDASRILGLSHCSQGRTLWDIHDNYWDCSELATPLPHNIFDEHSRCSHSVCTFFMDESTFKQFQQVDLDYIWVRKAVIWKSTCLESIQTLNRFGFHKLVGLDLLLTADDRTITKIKLTIAA